MVIDVSQPKTYPTELERIVSEYFTELPATIKDKIRSEKIKYDVDVRCAIEEYVGIFKADSLYNQLLDIMKNYEIIVYHSTKVLDKSCFLNNGLQPNKWNRYEQTMIEVLKALDVSVEESNKAIKLMQHEYNRKYVDREPILCFFSDLSLVDNGQYAGYEQFCENIGGEVARWALKDKEPAIYKYLKNNGEQFIVKFKIAFSDIVFYQQDVIIYQFISYVAGKYFWNYHYQVNFDGATTKTVLPEKILDFLPYNKKVDY